MGSLCDNIDRRTANVYGIYGHLGGGKSLTAVEIMLWSLQLGWHVSSNIRLLHLPKSYDGKYDYIDDFAEVDPWSLPVGAPRGCKDTYRSVIVVDECAEFFDQYSSTSPQVRRFLSWLRHSSKRGQFVFLIVQQPEFLAKSLRILINKWIVCLDMEQLRLPVLKIHVPFCGGFVMRRIMDRYGNIISSGWCMVAKSDIGWYYQTAQSIALAGRGQDEDGGKPVSAPIRNQLSYFFLASLYITVILWLIW